MKRNILNREYVYNVSVLIAGILPFWLCRVIARLVAFVSYVFLKDIRNNVEKNLSHVYKDSHKIKSVARKIFLNYGSYLADWAKLNYMDEKNVISMFSFRKGRRVIEEGLQRGKGIVLLTAHLGNWELGGAFFSSSGFPINVITAQDESEGVARVRERMRKHHNIKTITIEKGQLFFINIVRALQKNEIVAMLMDRYEGERGILIDFFGKPTYFPIGPILLARSTGAAVIPAFIIRGSDGKYKGIADSIVDMEFTDDREKDIKTNLSKIVNILEKYIREYTDQWYNFTYLWDIAKKHSKDQE